MLGLQLALKCIYSCLVFVPQVRNKYLESLFSGIPRFVDKLLQSLDFSGQISPNGIQPKMILNVVGYPKMLSNLHIHHDLVRVTGLGEVFIWESINHKYVYECLFMTSFFFCLLHINMSVKQVTKKWLG